MNGPEVLQEDQLLAELSALSDVDLWRVQWGLSQNLLQNVPPVPPRWLRTADAAGTAKILQRCFQHEGALAVLTEVQALIGSKGQVCGLRRSHSDTQVLRPGPSPRPGPDFVRTQRRNLISRIQQPLNVLNVLQSHGFLNASHRDVIRVYALRKHKNQVLVDLVLNKGDRAQEMFYKVLRELEPFLLQELDHEPIKDKHALGTSVLSEMLERLVSDELRTFQWLVSDHMSGERRPLISGEQLAHADRPTTQRLLENHYGPEQAENIARNILMKIVPPHSLRLSEEAMTSQRSYVSRETNANTTPVDITPAVHEDGDMFRLRCVQPGLFRCRETGLLLEGSGDVFYQTVPWDLDFLSCKGLRPAGPLFRFTLLAGSFHRLHLPHCQLLKDDGQDFLSVAHVTDDRVDFLTPGQVTSDHVVVDVSGFSCFGLVIQMIVPLTPVRAMASQRPEPSGAIRGLVLLFSRPSTAVTLDSSLYVLLLPRNVTITQVMKEWKRRIGAEYVEVLPECELIPNQSYQLTGQPVTVIQPESAKFLNFQDYNNFLPSFEVQLGADVKKVELELTTKESSNHLMDWLLGSTKQTVWHRVVQLKGFSSPVCAAIGVSDSMDATSLLLDTLKCLHADDLKTFQRLLSLQPDPIPRCQLEEADRTRTVDLMVQKYQAEGAKQLVQNVLRRMDYNQLAEDLQST
ncbi:Hypothetical predicted protein [Scomber scombrus]|uniref:Uncharacterized protein n=1 Tax=Scomber scombrus TaxID=13677 RepID=A0AAV1Q9V9_SCOSC